jgi:hypothetical protein
MNNGHKMVVEKLITSYILLCFVVSSKWNCFLAGIVQELDLEYQPISSGAVFLYIKYIEMHTLSNEI